MVQRGRRWCREEEDVAVKERDGARVGGWCRKEEKREQKRKEDGGCSEEEDDAERKKMVHRGRRWCR